MERWRGCKLCKRNDIWVPSAAGNTVPGALQFSPNALSSAVINLQVTYRRTVDYISAACVMFPRQYYLDVGGFDPVYGMGYYEDTDMAMVLASRGLEVVYQPLAVVSSMRCVCNSNQQLPSVHILNVD